jgi:four helix bundle protein
MNIAQGSLEECRYHLILAKDLGYSDRLKLIVQLDEVSRLLDADHNALVSSADL